MDALGFATTMAYDALNRNITSQSPSGGITTTAYDLADNVVNTGKDIRGRTLYRCEKFRVFDTKSKTNKTYVPANFLPPWQVGNYGFSRVLGMVDPKSAKKRNGIGTHLETDKE